MEFKDYYATLGVGKTATGKELKQAYRKLARKYHPDVNPGDKAAEARFKEVNEAYEVLGDPEKRKKYDELGANWRLYEQAQQAGRAGAGPFGAGSPFGGWTASTGGAGGFRTMTEEEMRDLFGDEDPFSDFFHTFFGGASRGGARPARGGRAPRARQGRDLEQAIDLSLEEAYHGVTRRFSIRRDGQARTVDVRIPPGVRDGSRVRVAGEGEAGTGGAGAGDLFLRIRLQPHPVFERRGQDLYVRVPVSIPTAVLGGEAEVPTMAGRPARLRIPQTTQVGQVFRLKGYGMPAAGRPEEKGDLYATIEVQVPRQLTAEQRRHYEGLQKLEKNAKHSAA